MKANRKFLNNDDEAVSPVIAVILMVAITVVLAATVYVWVSGFGSNSSKPANTLALTSGGAIYDCDGVGVGILDCKQYVVASASPGLKWSDMKFSLNGEESTYEAATACPAAQDVSADSYSLCDGDNEELTTDLVDAGDALFFQVTSGQTLRVIDAGSNSIILTLTAQ